MNPTRPRRPSQILYLLQPDLLFWTGERTKPALLLINLEDIIVELRNPLLSFYRELEITQRWPQIWLNTRPEELRVMLHQVHRRSIAQLFSNAGLHKLIKKAVNFAVVEWVSQLAYQISRPHERRLTFYLLKLRIIRNRKASKCDRSRYSFFIDKLRIRKPVTCIHHSTRHVIGR